MRKTISSGHVDSVNVLDMGCGRGKLLAYFSNILPHLQPDISFSLSGFDIYEHGARRGDYLSEITGYLNAEAKQHNWNERIKAVSSKDRWPYADNSFDFIVSNQVFEHVMDHNLVFGEIYRCLKTGGKSIHLFPVKEVIYEDHLHLPLAHKITGRRLLTGYIKFFNFIGIGRYSEHKNKGMTLDAYARSRSDYMNNRTNYLPCDKLVALARNHGLKVSFCYSRDFYTAKILSIFNRKQKYTYSVNRLPLFDDITFALLKYISSVTLLLEK